MRPHRPRIGASKKAERPAHSDRASLSPNRLLVNSDEAARMLSLGKRRLWNLTQCNAVPSRRIGRSVRYDPAELGAWIAADCPTDANAAERIRAEVRHAD